MHQPKTPPSLEDGTTWLPLEIIWIIIKELLIDLPFAAGRKSEPTTSPMLFNILTLNRHLHKLAVKAVYRTIILSSSYLLRRFYHVASSSPHLTCLVHNLWMGTLQLDSFSDSKRCSPPTPIMVEYILSKAPKIKRLALPATFIPHKFAELGSEIEHLRVGGGFIPNLPCKVKTVHIHGSIQTSVARYLKQRGIKRVVYDLERPCAPGAVGHIIHELLGVKAGQDDGELQLEFVIHSRISNWMRDQLSHVNSDNLLEGAFAVRTRRSTCIMASPRRTRCEEWAGTIANPEV
ncbi:unnamed protein product [Rhizoctonia solani]|uniref:Uncharacterized protein n=1 Tax=Rhizoctonia solani TaxID=456999 RepID=A0A8H3AKM6_9AGAM|nr:unnamed protein product [Rhizoctonia solani]